MKIKLLMVISILSMLLCACSVEGNEQINYDMNGMSAEPEAQEPEEQATEAQVNFDIQIMLEKAEEQEADLEKELYEDASLTQADMNDISYEIYMVWDELLNQVWIIINQSLDEEIKSELLEEQRAWITEKEAEVKQVGEEVGGSIAVLLCNQRAAELTRIRVYELTSYLGYNKTIPQNENSVEKTEEVPYQEEKTTITFIVEGVEEEVSAILYTRENYSISIPEEDWEMVTKGTWRSAANSEVQISVVEYTGEDMDSVRGTLSESGYEVSEYSPYLMSFEDRNGLIWNVRLFTKEEKVIGVFYDYPIEAAEGFGSRLPVIVNTFEWK